MTDDSNATDGTTSDRAATNGNGTLAVTLGDYKVLGDTDASDGTGVVGRATTASGTPVGVRGLVPNSTAGYGLATPDDAKIEGAIDTAETDFVAETGTQTTADAQNVVLGHGSNTASSGVVGATIAGGGFDDGSSDESNLADRNYATVGGGRANENYGPESTIAGGIQNQTSAQQATIGGGGNNRAALRGATIAGGSINEIYDTGYVGAIGGGTYNEITGDTATIGGGSYNDISGELGTIGGGANNVVEGKYGTIAGGGPSDENDTISTNNVVRDQYGTIGGGGGNVAGASGSTESLYATVGGGKNNTANGDNATIGGGIDNTASGTDGTVAGGRNNEASANQSTVVGGANNVASASNAVAAGRAAIAEDGQAFVYNDNTRYHDVTGDGFDDGLSSSMDVAGSGVTGTDTFHASAQGGFRFITGPSSVTYIAGGSTGWSQTSSRAAKTDLDPVDPPAVLESVQSLDLSTWEYTDGDGEGQGVRHVGPMAEQFHEELPFEVGDSDRHLNSINVDGVALAAIQGLADRVDDRADRVADLADRLERKDARIDDLATENERLRERNRTLEDRLDAVEAHLGIEGPDDGE